MQSLVAGRSKVRWGNEEAEVCRSKGGAEHWPDRRARAIYQAGLPGLLKCAGALF